MPKRLPFVALDGEGITLPDGEHILTLLGSSVSPMDYIENQKGLNTLECLEYLTNLAQRFWVNAERTCIFVSYHFTYDVSMMLGDVVDAGLTSLQTLNKVYIGGGPNGLTYRVSYLPKKVFRVDLGHLLGTRWIPIKGTLCEIYDATGFFQTSFVNALKTWNITPADELASMEDMKLQREKFNELDPELIKAYNYSECVNLVKLMDSLRGKLEDKLGLHLRNWMGAGSVASAVFKKEKIEGALPKSEAHEVVSAYFGGRIQCVKLGHFSDIHTYDLRSAYPYAMSELPLFMDVEPSVVTDGIGPYDLVKVRWNVSSPITPFPFRYENKSIQFHSSGIGWYHACEYFAALEVEGAKNIEVLEVRRIPYELAAKPFAFINEYYEQRAKLRAEGDEAHIAFKLALNSLYGKTAQKQGSRRRNKRSGEWEQVDPPYRSYMIAGAITAKTRSLLYKAAMLDPSNIVMFATDGIASRTPLALEQGEALGLWEHTPLKELRIYQPGMYLTIDESGKRKGKTRSIPASSVDWDYVAKEWEEWGTAALLEFTSRNFITYTTRSAKREFRSWRDEPKLLSLMPTKGIPLPEDDGTYRLLQMPAAEGLESFPYTGHLDGSMPDDAEPFLSNWEDGDDE